MLSMVAINMLLFVSKHFVYELPVVFFPSLPTHMEHSVSFLVSPQKSTYQSMGGQSYFPGDLLGGGGSPSQTVDTGLCSQVPSFPH